MTIGNSWDASTYQTTYRSAVGAIEKLIRPLIMSEMNINSGGRVLECGLGSGKWSAGFALLGYQVYAIDNSEAMIEQVRKNFPNIKIQYIVKDVRDAPLIYPPVDLLFSEGLIEHFLDDEERMKVLTNFYNAVKGYVSIIVPYKSIEENEIYYTKKKLCDEVKTAGFKILNVYIFRFLSADAITLKNLVGINAQKQ